MLPPYVVYAQVRRIADDDVKAAGLEHGGECALVVEGVDAVALIFGHLPPSIRPYDLRADERVAALDVVAEVGEGAFVPEGAVGADGFGGFAFEAAEQQGELADFDSLII